MSKKQFLGNWRITEMEAWDQDYIDAEIPGFISFDKHDMGEFHFGYVHGHMDCRYTKRDGNEIVEFSWEGNDEMDPAFGRGFATIKDGNLLGQLFFHEGDDSEFKAIRE
jgi:hypothetical protein